MENIKSAIVLKKIFNYIFEKKKLKIIKYNKRTQNILNLSIINYKISSGRYIVLEENNKGKEYNILDDAILYDGEYLNLRRNGKGKEYNPDGVLIYEGEYKNGKKHGKGKDYNTKGLLIFEGLFIEGQKIKG